MGTELAIVFRKKHAPFAVAASAFLLFGLNSTVTSAFSGLVQALGGSLFVAGLQNSLFILAAIALRFPFEPLSSRVGCAWMLRIGALGYLLPCFLLAPCNNLVLAILLHMLQAVGLAAFQPGVSQYLAAISDQNSLGQRLGMLRFATTASLMVGPLVLFPFINGSNYQVFFLALGMAGVLGFLLTLALPSPHKHAPSEPMPQVTHTTMNAYVKHTNIYTVALLLFGPFVLAGGYSCLLTFGQHYSELNLDGFASGILFTWISIGGLAGSVASGFATDNFGPKRSCGFNVASNAAGLILLAFAPHAAVAFLGAFFCGVGYFGATTSFVAAASIATGQLANGKANPFLSRQQSALDAGMVIGSAAAGALLQWGFSFTLVFCIAAFMVLICLPGWILRYPANHT